MNTNIIEQRLLDKELATIQAEVNRGMEIVNNVLGSLPHSSKQEERESEVAFIEQLLASTYSIYKGKWQHSVTPPLISNFPESMRKRILKKAVEQFLEELEAMQEITSNLET